MVTNSTEFSEAILFVDSNRVTREMLYSEFEAVLDGYVPIDLAGEEAKGVYLRVNRQLTIMAAVFFLITFDDEGYADKRWNIPLEQLADNSAKGPDMGAGAIRLACRSQCSIAWHQQNLWDPEMSPGKNHFVLLKKYIKANRLGLPYTEPEAPPVAAPPKVAPVKTPSKAEAKELEKRLSQKLRRQFEQEFRDHMAQLLKEQRLRILTVNSQKQQEVQKIQLDHQKRLEEYRHHLAEQKKQLEIQVERNRELKEVIEGQASKIEGVREYYEHKLKSAQMDEGAQLQALKNNYEAELAAKVEAATMELKDTLQVRDVELLYRAEQEASQDEEIKRLREENQVLLQNSSEQLLEKLDGAGLNFVAYHPGAGHLTIPLPDMGRYLEDPTAYAANKCGVSVNQYKDWLDHYNRPVCRALKSGGDVCGDLIERVPTPGQFHTGEHDRCDTHKTSPTQTFAAVQM